MYSRLRFDDDFLRSGDFLFVTGLGVGGGETLAGLLIAVLRVDCLRGEDFRRKAFRGGADDSGTVGGTEKASARNLSDFFFFAMLSAKV